MGWRVKIKADGADKCVVCLIWGFGQQRTEEKLEWLFVWMIKQMSSNHKSTFKLSYYLHYNPLFITKISKIQTVDFRHKDWRNLLCHLLRLTITRVYPQKVGWKCTNCRLKRYEYGKLK